MSRRGPVARLLPTSSKVATDIHHLAAELDPCFDISMSDDLSNEAAHKLQAVLNHDWLATDKDFPPGYIAACWRWFSALSAEDQVVAAVARSASEKGNEAEAMKAAAVLPPAPVCPLL